MDAEPCLCFVPDGGVEGDVRCGVEGDLVYDVLFVGGVWPVGWVCEADDVF